jgi:RimJ/RimL family protein N-acetyltransferase
VFGPILRGTLVTLRPPNPEETKLFVEWLGDADVTRYLLRRMPPALHEEEEFFKRIAESKNDVWWVLAVGEKPVGAIGIHGIDWINAHATTGIMIGDKSYWGRGIAGEAMQLRTRFAFGELNLHKLKSYAIVENEASRRALERAGYKTVGTFREEQWIDGAWHDMWIGEVVREEWEREHGSMSSRPQDSHTVSTRASRSLKP